MLGMDIELIDIVLAIVSPLYPSLFVINEKIGKYEVICTMFETHQKSKEAYHGSRTD